MATKINEERINQLEAKGFHRWQKGNFDRLYINPQSFGLEVEYYNTGNVRHGELNGIVLSHAEARRILGGKYFVDVNTGEVVAQTNADSRETIINIMKGMVLENA